MLYHKQSHDIKPEIRERISCPCYRQEIFLPSAAHVIESHHAAAIEQTSCVGHFIITHPGLQTARYRQCH